MKETHEAATGIEIAGQQCSVDVRLGELRWAGKPAALLPIEALGAILSGVKDAVGVGRLDQILEAAGRASFASEPWSAQRAAGGLLAAIAGILDQIAALGWGRIEVIRIDEATREVDLRILGGWESSYRRGLGAGGGSSYLGGMLAELCARFFGAPCRSEHAAAEEEGQPERVVIRPSARVVEAEKRAPLEETGDQGALIRALQLEIEERKKVETALRSTEQRLRSYFDLSLLGVAITSPEKGWIEINDTMCTMLGYSREELTTMTWSELTHPDDLVKDIALFNQVLAGELDGYELSKRYIRKGGTMIDTVLSVKCVRRPDRSVDFFAAFVQDITSRVHAESALRAHVATIERQRASIWELSAPLIQVWDGVLALPLIGLLDSARAAVLMDRLLSRIVETGSHHAILDLTGVDVVDSAVAKNLQELVQAMKLLGTRAMVTGIHANVAQTMIAAGLDFPGVVIRSKMQDALKLCIASSQPKQP